MLFERVPGCASTLAAEASPATGPGDSDRQSREVTPIV
jgi:hypothetical protein